jgi:Ca2+-binding EF-hand superfamily protein
MSHLNYRKLQKIKEDFCKQEDGLSMEQFIKVMLIHLPETRDRVGLVKNLIELFRQIDVNNDESLEWEEFTGHIIELGKYARIFILL